MELQNPFPIWIQFIDLSNYKESIDIIIENITRNFNKKYITIVEDKVKETFWKLAKLKKNYNPNNWYDVFAVLIGRHIIFQSMFKNNIIPEEPFKLYRKWYAYLSARILKYEPNLTDNFIERLCSKYPIASFELERSQLIETVSIIKDYDLINIFKDPNLDSFNKIRKFKETFLNFFNQFLDRSEHVGRELSKYEGNRKCGRYDRDLYKIFQLTSANQYSPPDLTKDLIISLIHIRNACAHSGIYTLNNNEVRIIDKKTNGEITFNKRINLNELINYYYKLLLIDKEFENIALYIYLNRWIRRLTYLYNRIFHCGDCDDIGIYYVPPETLFIICKKCKMIHLKKELKYNSIRIYYIINLSN